MKKNKILITGASGFLGRHLLAFLDPAEYEITAVFLNTPVHWKGVRFFKCDLTEMPQLENIMADENFDFIVHTAYRKDNMDLNILQATRNITKLAKQTETRLIFLSSDLVFSGFEGDYDENHKTEPLMEYGKYKLWAEEEVLSYSKSVIIRTSLIYCIHHLPGNYQFIANSIENQQEVLLNEDEVRSPVFVDDLCFFIDDLMKNFQEGIFHFAGPESLSRYDFGKKLTSIYYPQGMEFLVPSKIEESKTIRSANCTLNSKKAFQYCGFCAKSVDYVIRKKLKCKLLLKKEEYETNHDL